MTQQNNENTTHSEKIPFLKKYGRYFTHGIWNVFTFFIIWFFESKIKYSDLSLFIAFILIAFYTLYFGSYLLERMAISHNHKKSHFYLIRKLISVLLNLSYAYSIAYFIIYSIDPNAISDNSHIGNGFIEKLFNFYYYSLGNFLGYDSGFEPQSFLFKVVQVFQYLTAFIMLVYLFTNFDTIKKQYSDYYKEKD